MSPPTDAWSSSTSTTFRRGMAPARPFCAAREKACGTAGVYGHRYTTTVPDTLNRVPIVSSGAPRVALACPDCRAAIDVERLSCTGCGRVFEAHDGIPVLLPSSLLG